MTLYGSVCTMAETIGMVDFIGFMAIIWIAPLC